MVFNDSTIKIRTRVRSAIGRLRPSKSTLGLSTLQKNNNSHAEIPPPVPPILPLPESLSQRFLGSSFFDNLLDGRSSSKSVNSGLSLKLAPKVDNNDKDFNKLPILNQMLERQGLLNSPISVHLTTLLEDCNQHHLSSSTRSKLRTPTESLYSSSLACSAGPFTPELVPNPVGLSTPEFTATYSTTSDLRCFFPYTSPKKSPGAFKGQEFCSPTNITNTRKTFLVNSPDPSSPPLKMNVLPARRCLKRRGPNPCAQPISYQLLQSVMTKNGNSFASSKPSLQRLNMASPCFSSGSSDLDYSTPDGSPLDPIFVQKSAIADGGLKPLPTEAKILTLPMSFKYSKSTPKPSRSPISSFLTHGSHHLSIKNNF
ncbi:hypothetical protein O181_062980 [Austropuccinia psidii MF-1]|uniref:Uncharacterized protein n=1 Tax=Austropuccinia psidii MF-1 TaxID=1389203 RepID=A0A9Q3EQD3_9BASI|nr:hypothetical protein [Austropuccinia psidii MF-1]